MDDIVDGLCQSDVKVNLRSLENLLGLLQTSNSIDRSSVIVVVSLLTLDVTLFIRMIHECDCSLLASSLSEITI
jgi:hypothetical protein